MRTQSPKHLGHGQPDKWNIDGVLLDDGLADRGSVDFAAIFGNTRPVEVEIGTGKGTFLMARASARPEANFLGIEWARAYALYSADRFRRAGLTNVKMLRTDAGVFFRKCIPTASLWRVHIYFPDPWPKKRHHRRRLLQDSFVDELRRVLKPGGQVLVVTDHRGYFEQISRVFTGAPRLAVVPFPQMADEDGHVVGTNFEKKYIAQGRPFYKLARMRY
jgi:tRNA (guanine-N7-)-methyltransferase